MIKKKTLVRWLSGLIFLLIASLTALLLFYNNLLKYPSWTKYYSPQSAECTSAKEVQKRFNPTLSRVTLYTLSSLNGNLKAWHVKALKNRTGKGAILIHGGGGDHNLFVPYAHFLSQKGWDSLLVDLPNHGCSYNNKKGIQFGVIESENFGMFYEKAQSLFNVEAIFGTSLGSSVAVLYSFKTAKPAKLILENPMLNLTRIIQDQKAYYIPTVLRSWLQWNLLFINKELNLNSITELKPAPNQKLLVMYGTNDILTPPSLQADEVKKAWGDQADIKIISGAKHSQLIQHSPGYVQKLVDDFLEKK